MKQRLFLCFSIFILLFAFVAVAVGRNDLFDSQSEKRIIGGFKTSIYRFPHHVAIVAWKKARRLSSWQYLCGGSIINDRWILTAAHCLIIGKDRTQVLPCNSVKVAVGKEWSHFFWSWFKEYFVYVDKVVPHPRFVEEVKDDIGLLRLTKKLKFRDTIRPVALPHSHEVDYGQDVYVTGFGLTERGGGRSYQLKAAALQVADRSNCARLPGFSTHSYIAERLICLISKDNFSVPCDGDSGGGVVRQLSDGSYVIIGVFIWSYCQARHASGAARVDYHLPWIQGQIED